MTYGLDGELQLRGGTGSDVHREVGLEAVLLLQVGAAQHERPHAALCHFQLLDHTYRITRLSYASFELITVHCPTSGLSQHVSGRRTAARSDGDDKLLLLVGKHERQLTVIARVQLAPLIVDLHLDVLHLRTQRYLCEKEAVQPIQ